MAMRIDVRPYCDGCLQFEPDVEKPSVEHLHAWAYDGAMTITVSTKPDTIIRCKNRECCAHVEGYFEKEKINEASTKI